MAFSQETRKAISEIVLALSVANEGLQQNTWDDELTNADDAAAFLYATIAEIPENDTERNVFEHYLQVFRQGGTMPEFTDDVEENRAALMEYLADMERYFEDLDYVPEGTLGEMTNQKRGREDEEDYDGEGDEEENVAPPPEHNTRRRLGNGRRRRGGKGGVEVASGDFPPPPPPPEEPTKEEEPEQYSKEQILRALSTTNDYLENESAYIAFEEPFLPTKDEAYKYFKKFLNGVYAGNYSEGEVTDIKNVLRYVTNFLVPVPVFTTNPGENNGILRRWMTNAQAKVFQADVALAGRGKPSKAAAANPILAGLEDTEEEANARLNKANKIWERSLLARPQRIDEVMERQAERTREARQYEADRKARLAAAPKAETREERRAAERNQVEYRRRLADAIATLLGQDYDTLSDEYIATEIEMLQNDPEYLPFVRRLKQERDKRHHKRYKEYVRLAAYDANGPAFAKLRVKDPPGYPIIGELPPTPPVPQQRARSAFKQGRDLPPIDIVRLPPIDVNPKFKVVKDTPMERVTLDPTGRLRLEEIPDSDKPILVTKPRLFQMYDALRQEFATDDEEPFKAKGRYRGAARFRERCYFPG